MRYQIGLLYGPYARQVTKWKLKFWFVHAVDDGPLARYEVAIDTFDRKLKARHRPFFEGKVPTHASNFDKFLIPADLTGLPHIDFPRHERDSMVDAALDLLRQSEHIADITRVSLIGELPSATTTRNYAPTETSCCTSDPHQPAFSLI